MGRARKDRVKRVGQAHRVESRYAAKAPRKASKPIRRDVHDFLDYCRLRAEVARSIESIFRVHDNCALVGYLTGSVGPLVNARLLVEADHPHSVRYVGSLKEWAPPGKTPEEHYDDVLDDLWGTGIRHFVLADEYVGGGSFDRALKLTWQWVRRRAATAASFSVVAFAARKSRPKAALQNRVDEYRRCGMPICLSKIFRCRMLLEMDKAGKAFNPLYKEGGKPGEYEFQRLQAPVILKCQKGGATGMSGGTSADQIFGSFVERVIGAKEPHEPPDGMQAWPEAILDSSCNECRELLLQARAAW